MMYSCKKSIKYIVLGCALSAVVSLFLSAYHDVVTAHAAPYEPDQILSWCIADIDGNDGEEIIMLAGGGEVDGMRYANELIIYDLDAIQDTGELRSAGYNPLIKKNALPVFSIDLSVLKPLMVQAGDIDGDGRKEIAICVYKTAQFHPIMAKRPFFYRYLGAEQGLEPVWLGSRLSRPFDDYMLADVNDDGVDEIISIERLENGDRVVCAYYWKGFGFELLLESKPFKCEPAFASDEDIKDALGVAPTCIFVRCTDDLYILRPDDEMTSFLCSESEDIYD